METSKLQMIFLDEDNKTFTLSVDSPRIDLTAQDVSDAMATIIDTNIFQSNMKNLVSSKEANVVVTTINKLDI